MEMFFTGDHHFGHANIIKYCNRPFNSVEEMDEMLIDEWNYVVNPDDIVYHLGDIAFSMNELDKIIRRLNGTIYIIPGNHIRRGYNTAGVIPPGIDVVTIPAE